MGFLSSDINHLGSTDPNHNMKSWKHQIFTSGGTEGCTMGYYMIDVYYFLSAGVATDLIQPPNFAADLPVLKLFLHGTILKLSELGP